MPIHDQGYRRYAGSRAIVGRAWQVITRTGVMSIVAKRQFIALMLFAWAPFVVRAVQIYVASNFQQASFLAPEGRDVPRVPRSAGRVRLLRDHLRGRRPHRQRPPRQRPAALSLQAHDARGIHRRQDGDPVPVPRLRHVAARHQPAAGADDLRRQLHVRAQQPLPAAGHHALLPRAGAAGLDDDAGAVVAVEEQPLRGGDVCGPVLLHHGALQRHSRHHGQEQLRVALAERLAPATG